MTDKDRIRLAEGEAMAAEYRKGQEAFIKKTLGLNPGSVLIVNGREFDTYEEYQEYKLAYLGATDD